MEPESHDRVRATRTDRRFSRLAEGRTVAEGYWPLPSDGLCLSSFLLLAPAGGGDEVLMGHIDPDGRWMVIGALDPERARLNSEGWMLPSCHLMQFEGPDEAAERILTEQLGIGPAALEPPRVFSEVYRPRRHPERRRHWDLQFLSRGTLPSPDPPRHPAWKELRFIRPSSTPRSEFTRAHDEVLELVGFHLPD